jgi:hypothetical protein
MSQKLVGKDFKIKENYVDINGNHPKEGGGVNPENVVFEKIKLTEGKLLIDDKVEGAEEHIAFLIKNNVRIFVF